MRGFVKRYFLMLDGQCIWISVSNWCAICICSILASITHDVFFLLFLKNTEKIESIKFREKEQFLENMKTVLCAGVGLWKKFGSGRWWGNELWQ